MSGVRILHVLRCVRDITWYVSSEFNKLLGFTIRLIVPGGKPASTISSPRASVPRGDYSEDLKIKVLPAATAGASLWQKKSNVKFHGAMPAQTPNGSYRIILYCPSPSSGNISQCNLWQ